LDVHSEQETVERREAALKRMLSTPHESHAEAKIGKRRPKAQGAKMKGKPGS
jgi:hypothetical protein